MNDFSFKTLRRLRSFEERTLFLQQLLNRRGKNSPSNLKKRALFFTSLQRNSPQAPFGVREESFSRANSCGDGCTLGLKIFKETSTDVFVYVKNEPIVLFSPSTTFPHIKSGESVYILKVESSLCRTISLK